LQLLAGFIYALALLFGLAADFSVKKRVKFADNAFALTAFKLHP